MIKYNLLTTQDVPFAYKIDKVEVSDSGSILQVLESVYYPNAAVIARVIRSTKSLKTIINTNPNSAANVAAGETYDDILIEQNGTKLLTMSSSSVLGFGTTFPTAGSVVRQLLYGFKRKDNPALPIDVSELLLGRPVDRTVKSSTPGKRPSKKE